MREILFRGKNTDNGKWVYGFLCSQRTISVTSPCGNTDEIVVFPETVGQYTGFTDKNGEKIFEGDIVKVNKKSTTLVGKVEFDLFFGGFTIVPKADCIENLMNKGRPKHREYEVIGNIYDNIELL